MRLMGWAVEGGRDIGHGWYLRDLAWVREEECIYMYLVGCTKCGRYHGGKEASMQSHYSVSSRMVLPVPIGGE